MILPGRTTPRAAIAPRTAGGDVSCLIVRRLLAVALAVASLSVSDAFAGIGTAELQAVLDAARPSDEIAVIVGYRSRFKLRGFRKLAYEEGGEDLAIVAEQRRARRRDIIRGLRESARDDGAAIAALAREKGARSLRTLWMANSIALRANREVIWQLLADPRVGEVRLDKLLLAPVPMTGTPGPPQWNVSAVGAPDLWTQGYDGTGAVVAILDSGVDLAHPDLGSTYRGGTNSWYDPYGEHATPYDRLGHGTQALGLAVGGSFSGAAIGVAPGAKWIAAKIFNDAGAASESAIHLAFQWVMDPDGNPETDDAPDVVSNSWDIAGENTCNSAFQADIDALRAADVNVIFAAGNYGPGPSTSVSPANNARVLSVGAVDIDEQISPFSSRGPSACDGSVYPQVVAPGDGLRTTDLSFGGTPSYVQVAGTSFSAPTVAGVVALLRSALPTATAAEVDAALAATARDLGDEGPDDHSGYGLVDAPAAHAAMSQVVDEDADGHPFSRDCDDQDASVHPGAHEKKRDGTDQDCNGYDLTIEVKYAVYARDGSKLALRVTSGLRSHAGLEIVDVGPLTWRAVRRDWIFDAATPPAPMRKITIRGVEGEVTVRPRPPLPGR